MNTSYKLLLVIGFATAAALLGLKTYVFLNDKIKGSKTGYQLLCFSLLLFLFLAALLAGTIACLVWLYVTLSALPEGH